MESSFEFVRELSVAANVTRLARARLTDAIDTLASHPEIPLATAVHDARRGLKRLRALLRLARAGLGEETFRRENLAARDAARELSAARDAQVLVSAFDALGDDLAGHVAPGTLAAVAERLRADVAGAVGTLRADDRVPRAVALLTAARERLDAWPWEDGEADPWGVPEAGLKNTYRSARRAMRRATKGDTEEEFHEWRKQVKHLGAHVAALRPLRPKAAARLGKALDKLADLLGDEHDFAVLDRTLAGLPEEVLPPVTREALGGAIAQRRATLRQKAQARGRRIFDGRPGEFARHWRRGWEKLRAGC